MRKLLNGRCKMIHPYGMYRAWKENKRPYILFSEDGKYWNFTWASSLKQCQSKFRKWKCRCLIPHAE